MYIASEAIFQCEGGKGINVCEKIRAAGFLKRCPRFPTLVQSFV